MRTSNVEIESWYNPQEKEQSTIQSRERRQQMRREGTELQRKLKLTFIDRFNENDFALIRL